MVGPGREPYPDPVAVGFEPAFHGGPEQRVGPRDIPAEHQHVGAEAFRHGGCERRQPLPVFVEQAPCRGVFRMAFGSFACAGLSPARSAPGSGRIPSGSRRPHRRCPLRTAGSIPSRWRAPRRPRSPACGRPRSPTRRPCRASAPLRVRRRPRPRRGIRPARRPPRR